MILVLNMADLIKEEGLQVDVAELSLRLGVPVVALSARENTGVAKLKKAIGDLNQVFWPATYSLIFVRSSLPATTTTRCCWPTTPAG